MPQVIQRWKQKYFWPESEKAKQNIFGYIEQHFLTKPNPKDFTTDCGM